MSEKNLIKRLYKSKLIDCPRWLPDNLMYLTVMGSHAYGCQTPTSDYDYYGFAMIPRDHILPHEYGLLLGFDDIPRFDQWQKSHFIDPDSQKDMEFTVYGIIRYFELLYGGNPNIIESLFTPRECVVYSTPASERIRENRHLFLSKQSFYKTRSYAFSQVKKLDRTPDPDGKRIELHKLYGFDTKFAGGVVRLIDNCEQILNGDLDLRRNKEMVKAIRSGEWKLENIKEYAKKKEFELDSLAARSNLPEKPNKEKIKELLLSCLENQYTNFDKSFVQPNTESLAIKAIAEIIEPLLRKNKL